MKTQAKVNILGVSVDNLRFQEALDQVFDLARDGKKHYIVTPNPEIVVHAQKDKKFLKILNKADLSIPDGIGLVWASKFLGQSLKERVAGVDLAEKICEESAKNAFTIGFLGGRSDVAEKAAECQKKKYSGLKVVFAKAGDFKKPLEHLDQSIDILFVGYGFPKQEYWIENFLEKSNVKVAMAVGGTLDYFAQKARRAPKLIQALGLEWLWRLTMEPWRIKRQFRLLEFIFLVIKTKFKTFHGETSVHE